MKIVVIGAPDLFDLTEETFKSKKIIVGYSSLKKINNSSYKNYKYLGKSIKKIIKKFKDINFVVGIADNLSRQKLVKEIKLHKYKCLSLIHPSVVVYKSSKIKENVIIHPNSIISSFAEISEGAYIGYNCLVGHDVKVGSYSFISPGTKLLGECNIGKNVFIGSNAVIFPKVKIGDNVIISSGAHVRNYIRKNQTVINSQSLRTIKNYL